MKKLGKVEFFSIFILFQPLLDLLTSFMMRYHVGTLTLGIVVRSIFILIMLVYLFFFNSSKYKSISIKYVFLLFVFSLFYFISKPELITNFSFFIKETAYLIKYLYFPVLFIVLLNFHDQYKLDRKKFADYFVINLFVYAILLIIPFTLGISFDTYETKGNAGVVGIFYSANEVSALLTMLFPVLFLYISKKIDYRIAFIIFTVLFSVMLIGTKVAFFGTLAFLFVVLIYYIVNHNKYRKSNYWFVTFLIIFLFTLSSSLPVVNNLRNAMGDYNKGINEDINDTCHDCDDYEDKDSSFISRLLSSRDKRVKKLYDIYDDRPIGEKAFGIGFSNRLDINTKRIERNVEMDFFEVFLRYGVVGFLIYILAFFYLIYRVVRNIVASKFRLNIEQLIYIYMIIIAFGISFIAGHVFGSPPVSIYLALLLVFGKDVFKVKKNFSLNKNKITFLCLHLGLGGIERATISSANALCTSKDVTIISFYKLSDKLLYDVDSRVKIKYLYDGKPNREKFILALKEKRFFTMIKEGFISLFILIRKRLFIIREIRRIREGIVVSTRVEFSVLLSRYGRSSILKVAQEHYYHDNDKKYLRKMKYGYGNIDYIVALTNRLRDDYLELFKGNSKIKPVTIPNMLSDFSKKISSLKNKTVVTVSRLHKNKRVNEIIDIAKRLENSGWQFKIIGDGEERNNLEKQIRDLKLNKTVKLLGSIPNNEVIKEISNSSIFVMASISEGFAIVVAEALSVGVPCVCYEMENGIVDIIDDGRDGYLIKDRNADLFTEKLESLMNDFELRKKMGDMAVIKAKRFSKEQVLEKWNDLIDNASL